MPLKLPKPKMILLSAAGLTVVYFGGCYLMARNYISPIRFATTDRPPFLTEAAIANGKYDIPVWQTRGLSSDSPKQDVFIMVHGYGGDRSVWNNLAAQFEHSAEIVIPATMGQTESPAPRVGFGLGESDEILTIAKWVKSENPTSRIHLVGVSMGGSACWIAAGKHPELFDSVISEGAFARLDWATEEFLSTSLPAGNRVFWAIPFFATKMTGIRPSSIRPVDYAAKWKGKSLIIHAEKDELFTRRHSDEFARVVDAEVWIVPNAQHAKVSKADLRGYADRIFKVTRVRSLAKQSH